MHKLIQPLQNPRTADCTFCRKPSEEVRTLLRIAIHRIRKLLLQQRYSGLGEQSSPEVSLGINRLIRVLFERNQFELKYSKDCAHEQLRSLFCQKLKCRNDQLELAIDELCNKLARRNYELELISAQVKNVENSVLQLQDSRSTSAKTRKESQSIPSEEPMLPTTRQVKIEEAPEESERQGDVGGNGGYVALMQGFPFSYNIIYYGGLLE